MVASAIGAIGSIVGGVMGSSSASKAAGAQASSADAAARLGQDALAFNKEVYAQGRSDLAPYRGTGVAALDVLADLFIPGGRELTQLQSQLGELKARRAALMGAPPQAAGAPAQVNRLGGSEGGTAQGDPDDNRGFDPSPTPGTDAFSDAVGGGGYGGGDGGSQEPSSGYGGGDAASGGVGGGGYHRGGPITDRNPATYRENMPINVQEGEYVMSRRAVKRFGPDAFARLNRLADRKGRRAA